MVHRRSIEARQRRDIYRYLATTGFPDHEQGEFVCRIDTNQLISHLQLTYPEVDMSLVHSFEKGEILSDSRGRGTLQNVGVIQK